MASTFTQSIRLGFEFSSGMGQRLMHRAGLRSGCVCDLVADSSTTGLA